MRKWAVSSICAIWGRYPGPAQPPSPVGGGRGLGSFYGDNVDNKCEEDQIHILTTHPVCDVEMKHFPSAVVLWQLSYCSSLLSNSKSSSKNSSCRSSICYTRCPSDWLWERKNCGRENIGTAVVGSWTHRLASIYRLVLSHSGYVADCLHIAFFPDKPDSILVFVVVEFCLALLLVNCGEKMCIFLSCICHWVEIF